MVIDNIWNQGKISETVYRYVQVCYLLPTHYNLIFWISGRWPPFTSMHCCKRACKLPYTRLRRSSSIAATLSTMACVSSWIVPIRLRNTRSFRNTNRKKQFGTMRSGDRAGQATSPKLRTQVTRCCTFERSIATDHMKWRPLLYRSPSRQPRQAIAPAQYLNLKCVSLLRATLYLGGQGFRLFLRGESLINTWQTTPLDRIMCQLFPFSIFNTLYLDLIVVFFETFSETFLFLPRLLTAKFLSNFLSYLFGVLTAVSVFRRPNAIPPCFSIGLVLNFL